MVWKVIVLAISSEWSVFHVDRMWTSTRAEERSGSCGQGREVKNLIFLDIINGWTPTWSNIELNCKLLFLLTFSKVECTLTSLHSTILEKRLGALILLDLLPSLGAIIEQYYLVATRLTFRNK